MITQLLRDNWEKAMPSLVKRTIVLTRTIAELMDIPTINRIPIRILILTTTRILIATVDVASGTKPFLNLNIS